MRSRAYALALLLALPLTAAASAFVDAARAADRAAVIRMLEQGAEVGATAADGATALHWAVYHDDADLVKRLIEAGADVRKSNRYGSTPLSEAAVTGNTEIIARLLKAGADVESPNADGQTALMVVARSGNVAAAKLLLARGAGVDAAERWRDQTPLMWAAAQSQPEMMQLLIRHGARVDARSAVNDWERQMSAEPRAHFRPAGGLTPLLYAARQGCTECARVLVKAKADLDMADPEGVTPMLLAIMNLHFDFARVLLEAGANVNKWDWRGRTPLYAAVDMNTLPRSGWPDRPSLDDTSSLELIRLLLEAGADPDAQLKLNPMWRSIQDDRGKDMLLSIGATPLLRAAKGFDVPAIRLLLAHGADPDLENDGALTPRQIGGITPVMAAAGLGSRGGDSRGRYDTPDTQQRSIAAIQELLAGGANVDAADHHGRTALHGAAAWGWTEVVKFLIERGADPAARDRDGMSALDAALGKMRDGRLAGVNRDPNQGTAALLRGLVSNQEN
jgi:ankyrin repeat protein